MKQLTAKQAAFARNIAAGCTNRDAAVAAGYAVAAADVTAAKLMQHPGVRAAIKAATRAAPAVDAKPVLRAKYKDSMALLMDAMNCEQLPIGVRVDCAKALLPYQHAKLGEIGKKEKAKDAARVIARGGRNRFATKVPPSTNVVPMRRPED